MEEELRGDFESALKKYEEAKNLSHGLTPAICLLARCYEKTGQPEKSVKLYTGILKKANRLYRSILEREESNHYVRLQLALNYRRQKSLEKSIGEFKKIFAAKPQDRDLCVAAHYHWGSLLKEMGRIKSSKREFGEAIRLSPDKYFRSGAHFHLGDIYLQTKNSKKAKEEFLKCLKINSGHKAARENLSRISRDKSRNSVYEKVSVAS